MKSTIAAAVAAAVLTLPAGAHAATATVQGSCFASGQDVAITGTGWTPGASVTLTSDATSGSATADPAGSFATTIPAPFVSSTASRTIQVTVNEAGNPANTAALSFPVIRDVFYVDAKLNGNPRSTITWKFAGFTPGEAIYGHFRFGGKTLRNYRFGVAQAPCGTLSKRARRLPVSKLRYGTWKLKFDNSRTYSTKEPGRLGSLTIFRSLR